MSSNTPASDPGVPDPDGSRRLAVENHLSDLLDVIERREDRVRRDEADRTRALIEAVDFTETAVVPFVGSDYAHRNLVAEVALIHRTSERSASDLIQVATVSRALPLSLDALELGLISYKHLVAITDQAASLPIEAVAQFEREVLKFAVSHNVTATVRRARTTRERMHPESIVTRTGTAMDERRFWVIPLPDGVVQVGATVSAIKGMAIANRTTRIATALRAVEGETRTLAQLESDVFADLLLGVEESTDVVQTAGTMDVADHITGEFHIAIPMMPALGLSDDPSELVGYGPIDTDTALRLAAVAPYVLRLLTDPYTGRPVATDATRYRISDALKRWIRARDQHCRFPGCHRRAEAVDIDHTTGHADGGLTDQGNLALLCRHHHRLKDTAGWSLRQEDAGRLVWTSPSGRRYVTDPDTDSVTASGARLMEREYDFEGGEVRGRENESQRIAAMEQFRERILAENHDDEFQPPLEWYIQWAA